MSRDLTIAKLGSPVKSAILREAEDSTVKLLRSNTYEICSLSALKEDADVITYLEYDRKLGKYILFLRHLEPIKD